MRFPELLRTSAFKVTAVYAALFSLSALILFGIVYWSTSSYMKNALDASIQSDIHELQDIYRTQGREALIGEIRSRIEEASEGPNFYLLERRSGEIVTGNMPPVSELRETYSLRTPIRHFTRPVPIYAHGTAISDDEFLVVGTDAYSLREMQELILRTFAWGCTATLFFAIGGGILTSRRLLGRVESISRTSRDIMDGNLSRRIPLRGIDDEFDHLAGSLNKMLDRIETLLEGLRQVSNDIAHDLRTPLTHLRQKLESSERSARNSEELRQAIRESLKDTDGILETFGALLRIAQVESRVRQRGFAAVDLSELLQAVYEVYQPAAEEKRQPLSIDIEPGLTVFGDRELLIRLFSNLIENAIRHSPPETSIGFSAHGDRDGIWVCVKDAGPGIPVSEREKVFRRFYRLEASRSTPGNGLGLSLVAAVATLHDTELTLSDNRPGLRVDIRFPKLFED